MKGRLQRSLRHRDYRLYFIGQLISLHGTWMQNVAQAWLVYRLTGSSLMLGVVSFANLAPVLLLGLVGGAAADRFPPRRLFLATQVVSMVQALTLAGLTLSGRVQVEQVIGLAVVLGVAQAFEIPARHTMIAGLVPREDLHNAIALNSSMFNLARFVGPAVAGWLVASIGEGGVFLINGLSFLAVLGVLLAMGTSTLESAGSGQSGGALWAGLRYARSQPPVRRALAMLAVVSLTGIPYMVLMPVFAAAVFHGGPQTLGLLVGAAGGGALVGALFLAQRHRTGGLQGIIAVAGMLAGAGLVLFSRTTHLGTALAALPLVGFALTTLVASTNTFLQLSAPETLRGRVMSLFSVLFIGLAPLGNLMAGALAHGVGAPTTVA
ncbi:MAG: MFS transporter, partial [Gammaproteobacteria bacterium]